MRFFGAYILGVATLATGMVLERQIGSGDGPSVRVQQHALQRLPKYHHGLEIKEVKGPGDDLLVVDAMCSMDQRIRVSRGMESRFDSLLIEYLFRSERPRYESYVVAMNLEGGPVMRVLGYCSVAGSDDLYHSVTAELTPDQAAACSRAGAIHVRFLGIGDQIAGIPEFSLDPMFAQSIHDLLTYPVLTYPGSGSGAQQR